MGDKVKGCGRLAAAVHIRGAEQQSLVSLLSASCSVQYGSKHKGVQLASLVSVSTKPRPSLVSVR